jgi:hypothetical protein
MTLISSYISKFGVILASDSNLSNNEGNAGFGQKVFPIPHLNAGLAYSGVYTIGGVELDKYMNDFIKAEYFCSKSIGDFTKSLLDALHRDIRDYERNEVTIIHIAGFNEMNGRSHCEHWHISNTGTDSRGEYLPAENHFHLSNDFNTQTNRAHRIELRVFVESEGITYRSIYNGFAPGRMVFATIKKYLDDIFAVIWDQKDMKFQAPKNIFEFAHILKTHYEIVGKLFQLSNYSALYIGGETQTHLIPLPQNIDLEL